MSLFGDLKPLMPTNIVKVIRKYYADKSDKKLDLASGEYKDNDGKPWVLPAVSLAEQEIHDEQPIIADYLFPKFYDFPFLSAKLLLGENNPAIKDDRVASIQTISGTGALRLGAEFLVSILGKTVYYYSNPTWDNHLLVFDRAGFKEGRPYRYWCPIKHEVDFTGFLDDLNNAPQGAVIILHACAHNPTGIDLTKDQWKQIAVIMKERKLVLFFDSAFQGLAKSLEEDAWSVRYFVDQGFELFCSQSFSKNLGLYGCIQYRNNKPITIISQLKENDVFNTTQSWLEINGITSCQLARFDEEAQKSGHLGERIGNLIIVTHSKISRTLVESNISPIHKAMYLIPGTHGNRIVNKVLSKPELTQQWLKDLDDMKYRIAKSREQLSTHLKRLGTPGDWDFITRQFGISTLLLNDEELVEHLADKYHVYLRGSGRLNFSSITDKNVEYIAQAIHETLISVQSSLIEK